MLEDIQAVNDNDAIPGPWARRRVTLNRLGVVVLLLGMGGAILIDWSGQVRSRRQSGRQGSSAAAGAWQDSTLPAEDTKRFSRDIEMNYGELGVLIAKGQLWWANLPPADRWAILIATISSLAAIGCFLTARYSEG